MSTDENKNSGNNTNTAQDINPVIRKNRFQPNSRYFTIVIYGLMFVLGTILLVRIVGSFNNTVKLLGQALQVIAPFLVGAFIAFILYPLVRFFYRNLFKNTNAAKNQEKVMDKFLRHYFEEIIQTRPKIPEPEVQDLIEFMDTLQKNAACDS